MEVPYLLLSSDSGFNVGAGGFASAPPDFIPPVSDTVESDTDGVELISAESLGS